MWYTIFVSNCDISAIVGQTAIVYYSFACAFWTANVTNVTNEKK